MRKKLFGSFATTSSSSEFLEYLVQVAVENAVDVSPAFFDAVVGDAVLGEVVGSYLFRTLS